jgi:diacylglycerol kinase (ATP)
MLLIALWLPVTPISKAIMISSLFLILLMELVNTAIEAIVDRISDDFNALSKKAKDIGSLIVLLAFINCGVVWAFVLVLWMMK